MKSTTAFRSRRARSALVLALTLLTGAVAGVFHLAESLPNPAATHASYLDGLPPGAESHHKCAFCVAAPVFHAATAMPPATVERLTVSEPTRTPSRAHPAPASSTRHARAPPHSALS